MDRYESVAAIEYQGMISNTGETQGHYICDIKYPHSQHWYRTNDNSIPIPICLEKVSKKPYVILFKKC